MSQNNNSKNTNIPENNPSKAMDSKKEVKESPDPKTDQDFPGYPHYPAKEDMMNKSTGSHRVDADVEELGTGPNSTGVNQRFDDESSGNSKKASSDRDSVRDELNIRMGNEADVNSDDLAALNSTDAEIGRPQNVSNEDINTDMDIPGSELDDNDDEVGEEDEENNYYSLGGDRHEAQEEDPQSGPNRTGE